MDNRIEWKMRTRVLLRWAVAIVVTVLLGSAGYYLTPDLWPRPELRRLVTIGWLMVLGAGVVIGVLAWAVNASRVARRYGDAVLELETVPASLGGMLTGRIRAAATLAPDQALNLILQCEAHELGGGESGGGSWVKWESEQLLTLADCVSGPLPVL